MGNPNGSCTSPTLYALYDLWSTYTYQDAERYQDMSELRRLDINDVCPRHIAYSYEPY